MVLNRPSSRQVANLSSASGLPYRELNSVVGESLSVRLSRLPLRLQRLHSLALQYKTPTQGRLARELSCSREYVNRSLRLLHRLGLLHKIRRVRTIRGVLWRISCLYTIAKQRLPRGHNGTPTEYHFSPSWGRFGPPGSVEGDFDAGETPVWATRPRFGIRKGRIVELREPRSSENAPVPPSYPSVVATRRPTTSPIRQLSPKTSS